MAKRERERERERERHGQKNFNVEAWEGSEEKLGRKHQVSTLGFGLV